jgi:hypothetical protein
VRVDRIVTSAIIDLNRVHKGRAALAWAEAEVWSLPLWRLERGAGEGWEEHLPRALALAP